MTIGWLGGFSSVELVFNNFWCSGIYFSVLLPSFLHLVLQRESDSPQGTQFDQEAFEATALGSRLTTTLFNYGILSLTLDV